MKMMKETDKAMLDNFSPRSTFGDGNCFYRAVSLGIYGTQDMHDYLRFMTAVEILQNQELYDETSSAFVLRGEPVITPSYKDVVQSAVSGGSYAELVHIIALSAALGIAIQSYCCPTPCMGSALHPFTITVDGNSFTHGIAAAAPTTVMWSKTRFTEKDPNHFVLLVPTHRNSIKVFSLKPPSSTSVQPSRALTTSKPLLSSVPYKPPSAAVSKSSKDLESTHVDGDDSMMEVNHVSTIDSGASEVLANDPVTSTRRKRQRSPSHQSLSSKKRPHSFHNRNPSLQPPRDQSPSGCIDSGLSSAIPMNADDCCAQGSSEL